MEPGDATRVEVLDGTVALSAGDWELSVGARQGALALRGQAPTETTTLPPPPAELRTPQPRQVLRATEFDVVFEWSAVPGAQAYQVDITRDDRFFQPVEERRVGPEPSLRVVGLEPGTYFWRVSAIGPGGFEGPAIEGDYFVFVQRRP